MGKVYRVGSIYNTEYFNTLKGVDHCKPGGEEPESVVCVDAAGECNRLERCLEVNEKFIRHMRLLIEELRDACPVEVVHETEIGRRVQEFLAKNPLPHATSSERDGQRSYSG